MAKHINHRSLSLYLDGKIDAVQKESIEAHLSTCQICSESFSTIKASVGLINRLPEVSESEHFDFEFKRRLNEELAKRAEIKPAHERVKEILETLQPRVLRPVPVLIKAVTIVTIIAFFMGTIVWDQMGVVPAIASVEGDVTIYSAASREWQDAKAGMRVRSGDLIRVGSEGKANIESKRYEILLKEETQVRALDLERAFAKSDTISYGIDKGKMLVSTKGGFSGSRLKIDSPLAEIRTKSTGFLVKVEPRKKNKMWVGVLDGEVEVKSKLQLAGLPSTVLVDAGKATEVESGAAPRPPRYQSDEEYRQMQEIYGLGDQPMVVLLISMTPRRVHELLSPAGIYMSEKKAKMIPREIIGVVHQMNEAAIAEDKEKHLEAIHSLEALLAKYPNPKYNVKLLFFIAGYYCSLDEYEESISVLDRIIERHGVSSSTSLALCAKAVIYERYLEDHKKAAGLYREILAKYPDSLEAEESTLGLQRIETRY
jgi:hypothetical protein